jgi:hypothetical protein
MAERRLGAALDPSGIKRAHQVPPAQSLQPLARVKVALEGSSTL